ncbi:hypothetical protein AB4Y90_18120, partial [Chryseobacterium sp. 2TAF14]|uniref:hypothetical protein n=1 Tax=Chryseobacterium sp. 2TAF14 TaxID=3233007 RepID=UPI003F918544
LEESKLLEIRVEKGTFIPLGIPDFEGKNENEKIKFQIIIKQGTFERLTFKIKSESADIYSEKITQSLKEGDVFPIEWDGFSKDKVCDTTWFVNNNLIAEITDGTNTSQIKVNGKCKVKWIDIKINTNSKKVEVSLRVNLKESKVEKNVVKNFNELVLLTQEGLSKYWGRNKIRKIGNSIKINGNEYEIFINSVNIEANSMPALNVYASTTNYGRSRN